MGEGIEKRAQTSLSFLHIKKKKKLPKPQPTTGLGNPFPRKLNQDLKPPPYDQRGCVSPGPAGNAERCIDGGPSATRFFPAGVLGVLAAHLLEIGDVFLGRRGEREKGTEQRGGGKMV